MLIPCQEVRFEEEEDFKTIQIQFSSAHFHFNVPTPAQGVLLDIEIVSWNAPWLGWTAVPVQQSKRNQPYTIAIPYHAHAHAMPAHGHDGP